MPGSAATLLGVQTADALAPGQPGVNALEYVHRMALAHHQARHFGQVSQVYLSLAGDVLLFRFQLRHGEHLGDVVTPPEAAAIRASFCNQVD